VSPDAAAGQANVACVDGTTITPTVQAPACTGFTKVTAAYAAVSPSNMLDLYRPKTGTGPFPTVIWIHGGGWKTGSRADIGQAQRLVCAGFAVASIDYRLSGEATFPAQIYDVKAAIRYLRANAATYNLAPHRFAAFGSSAGGHLAALAGTSGGVAALEDLTMGNSGVSSKVQAVVDWYGPTDLGTMDSELATIGCGGGNHSLSTSPESAFAGCTISSCAATTLAALSPLTYVDAKDPPFLILHGSADCNVPWTQGKRLSDALRAAGACPSFSLVQGAGHGGISWLSVETQNAAATFLTSVL
jgi:acetyl esterase/lipase